jgi:hypothetical protein
VTDGEFDEDFVAAAPVREEDLRRGVLPPPSRESLREVKREARRRRSGGGPAAPGGGAPGPGGRLRVVAALGVVGLVIAGTAYAVVAARRTAPRALPDVPGTRTRDGAVPVVVPSYTPPPSVPADPFAGTKVAGWPVGAAGIVAPPAKAVGSFNAAQVADAYARTVRYLSAAMLDPQVLWKGDLAPLHATLDPRSVRNRTRSDPTEMANRFYSSVKPASKSIRVNGLLKPARVVSGTLRVDFSYVAAYALRPSSGGDTELVAIRRYGTMQFDKATGATVTKAWLYLGGYYSDHSACGRKWVHDGYLEVFLGESADAAPPEASPSAPRHSLNVLDPREPEPSTAACVDNTGGF